MTFCNHNGICSGENRIESEEKAIEGQRGHSFFLLVLLVYAPFSDFRSARSIFLNWPREGNYLG